MNTSKWQSHKVPVKDVETTSRFEKELMNRNGRKPDSQVSIDGNVPSVNMPTGRNRAQRRADERMARRMSKPAGRRKWCPNCDKYHFIQETEQI